MKENEQNKWEHMSIVEEKGGKLVRITADEGYILESKHGTRRHSVLILARNAQNWEAVEEN